MYVFMASYLIPGIIIPLKSLVRQVTLYQLQISIYLSNYLWLYSPLDIDGFFRFLILYIVGRTPCTGDQPVAMPLPTHRTTQIQNKRTRIHALSGIRTHDPSLSAGENGSYLRPRAPCVRCTNMSTGELSGTIRK
jgi:hypothetical protein